MILLFLPFMPSSCLMLKVHITISLLEFKSILFKVKTGEKKLFKILTTLQFKQKHSSISTTTIDNFFILFLLFSFNYYFCILSKL